MALPKEITEGGDLTEFWLNQQKLEEQRKFLGLPTYEEQIKRQAEGQTPVTPLEAFSAIARPIESVTGAPTRAAAKALSEGKGFGSAFTAFKEQFGKNPETAPTGEELASTVVPYGASPKLLGLGLDVTLDPSNLLGPGLAAGAAIGGLKRLRTAAEIASDIERLAPQNPLGFYSKLERALVEALPPTGTVAPGQVKNIAATQKAEEVAQTGLIPWLESKQTFTRDDLLEYLAQSRLDLSEIVRGQPKLEWVERNGRLETVDGQFWISSEPEGQKYKYALHQTGFGKESLSDSIESLKKSALKLDNIGSKTPTKYETYSLPGGSEYQETQFILNPKSTPYPQRLNEIDARIRELDPIITSKSPESAERKAAIAEVMALQKEARPLQTEWEALDASQKRFTSSHWKEENVLAHARTKKFKNTEGEQVFLVDEIQSDWHQKGREVGYQDKEHAELRKEWAKVFANEETARNNWQTAVSNLNHYLEIKVGSGYSLESASHTLWRQGPTAPLVEQQQGRAALGDALYDSLFSDQKLQELLTTAKARSEEFDLAIVRREAFNRKLDAAGKENAVPDAPLKKNWPEMVMKRMIRQAIDSGADGLAWTPGRIQAQRYSLSNHVNQVNLIGSTPSGAIILEAYGKADQPVFRKTLSKESEVSEYIGKELADRLLAQTPKKTAGTDSFRSLSGLDLEVGGEGMKAFYDKMLPDFMRSYVKKYGGKLETTEIISDGKKITVPYVRFTPEMKKKITTEGQPLYQVAAPITAGALLKEYIERNRKQAE